MNFKNIPLEKLKGYLKLKGWKFEKFIDYLDKIHTTKEGEYFEIFIPNNEEIIDYDKRIIDLINSLGAIEEKESSEIKEEIVNFGYDLLSFKFDTNSTKEGFLPLEYAGIVMKRIGDIIKFGACSELNSKNKYVQPYKEARELIKNCELAQTKKGSFIINVRVPLDDTYLEKKEEKEEYIQELGRKTIKRVIKGLSDVKMLDISDESKFNKEYDETINKNVCDSMSAILIKEDSNLKLNINARWNPSKKIEEGILNSVEIDPKSMFKKFKKMSVYLKHIPKEKITIISGEIREMRRQPEDDKTEKRLIKLYDENLKRNVYSWLEDDDYRRACDSHRDKKIVRIKGILTQKEGRWFLDKSKILEYFI